MLARLGAAPVDARLILSERAGQRAFALWARLIRLAGRAGSPARLPLLALFAAYLLLMIVLVVPPSLAAQRLLRRLLERRLEAARAYFELPSGR